ncbi:MAG TPA: MerR family transcriptional regulator [Thermotogota bacterium]|nr:MerR family transcriptional regulator [Thermotogota bacterium]HPR97215.1 MerR family transcriptional regulator [Thermotogota bacterium]
MYYTIGEMSEKVNISAHTLRFYAKEGLLPFVERSEGGIRMFKDEDFGWIYIIKCLKKTGMTIKEIKKYLDYAMQGDSTIDERLEMFREQQKVVEREIAELNEALDLLKYKQWYYEVAKEAGTCAVHDEINLEEIPEDFRYIKAKTKATRS